MGRSPKERITFTVVEFLENVGGYPYTYIFRGPDGDRRVDRAFNTPETFPKHLGSRRYRVGGQYVTTWRSWRHDCISLQSWKRALAEPDSDRFVFVEIWRCDTCDTPVHSYPRNLDIEQEIRRGRWGGWERLDDGQGDPVMRCWYCLKEHGKELWKEETMPSRTTYVVGCWSCRTPFNHKQLHYVPAKAWQEVIQAKWRLVEGEVNGRPISTDDNPHFRCPDCLDKFDGTLERRKVFHPVAVIAVAFAFMRKTGWISKEDAEKLGDGRLPTGELVCKALAGKEPIPDVNQADVDEANAAVAWLMHRRWSYPTNQKTGVYERQLAAELDARLRDEGVYLPGYTPKNYVTMHNLMAQIASAAIVYKDGLKKEGRKTTWDTLRGSQELPIGEYIHNVEVTITHCQPAVHQGKPVYHYKLRDAAGLAYKWFRAKTYITSGSRLKILKAKVVKHDQYQGVLFNQIVGVEVVMNEKPAREAS